MPSLDDLPSSLAIINKFADNDLEGEPKAVYKSEMKPSYKVHFEFVNKVVLTGKERRNMATFMDVILMECLDVGKQINCSGFMIQLLHRVFLGTNTHAIPYVFI